MINSARPSSEPSQPSTKSRVLEMTHEATRGRSPLCHSELITLPRAPASVHTWLRGLLAAPWTDRACSYLETSCTCCISWPDTSSPRPSPRSLPPVSMSGLTRCLLKIPAVRCRQSSMSPSAPFLAVCFFLAPLPPGIRHTNQLFGCPCWPRPC